MGKKKGGGKGGGEGGSQPPTKPQGQPSGDAPAQVPASGPPQQGSSSRGPPISAPAIPAPLTGPKQGPLVCGPPPGGATFSAPSGRGRGAPAASFQSGRSSAAASQTPTPAPFKSKNVPADDAGLPRPAQETAPASGKGKKKKGGEGDAKQPPKAEAPAGGPAAVDPPLPQPAQPAAASGGKKGKKKGVDSTKQEPTKAETPVGGPAAVDPPLPQPAQSAAAVKGKKGKRGGDGDVGKKAPQKDAPVEGVTKQLAQLEVAPYKPINRIPSRPGGQQMSRNNSLFEKKFTLEVNYLPIKFKDINLKIYHYDVTFNPDRPKSLYRDALRMVLQKVVPRRAPAFDGKKNLYAAGRPLEFPNQQTHRDSVKIFDQERAKDAEFDIIIKLVDQDLSLAKLAEYLRSGTSTSIPQDVIQGVDIAMRNAPLMNREFVAAGRSFFAIPRQEPVDLGGGFELWHGHYQSAIMAWKPYLNVDVSNKAFPRHQKVLDFIKFDLARDPRQPNDLRQPLDRGNEYKLGKFLKGLKIDYKMPSNDPQGFTKRTYKVADIGQPPRQYKFKPDQQGAREITVEQYFSSVKNVRLQYPHLPTIVTTNKNHLPIEFCEVTPNQSVMRKLDEKQTANMVRNAAKGTDIRKSRIMGTIQKAGFNADPCMKEFGITLDTNFEKVDAWILKPPMIRYQNSEQSVRNGVWQARNDKFINSPGLHSWVIINTNNRTGPAEINNLVKNFIMSGNNIGIRVNEPRQIVTLTNVRTEADFEREFKKFADAGIQILVVIMAGFGIEDIYSKIKRAAELKVGVLTQCLKSATCEFRKMNQMTATNILLKINSKISGVNHALSPRTLPLVLREPVMVVGADVTHPAPGSEGLSIAAVAASHDQHAFQYNMLYKLQPPRREMIDGLQEMIETQLKFFFQQCKCKPRRILYYRDGVSEGQFQTVLDIELRAIRAACTKLESDYKPGITFLVVQKRHHTRFFPGPADWDGDKNKNVRAGTLVDTGITHPTELDFYLVSHQSIQGTARPTKYHLLWDDNNFKQDDLEQLTYYLCHLFARCNRSVSYPAPTYYAHLAAFRARAWWDGQRYNSTDLPNEQATKGKIQDHIVKNAPMFFV